MILHEVDSPILQDNWFTAFKANLRDLYSRSLQQFSKSQGLVIIRLIYGSLENLWADNFLLVGILALSALCLLGSTKHYSIVLFFPPQEFPILFLWLVYKYSNQCPLLILSCIPAFIIASWLDVLGEIPGCKNVNMLPFQQ